MKLHEILLEVLTVSIVGFLFFLIAIHNADAALDCTNELRPVYNENGDVIDYQIYAKCKTLPSPKPSCDSNVCYK